MERTPTRFGKISIIMDVGEHEGYRLSVIKEQGNQELKYLKLRWNGEAVLEGKKLVSQDGEYELPAAGDQIQLKLYI